MRLHNCQICGAKCNGLCMDMQDIIDDMELFWDEHDIDFDRNEQMDIGEHVLLNGKRITTNIVNEELVFADSVNDDSDFYEDEYHLFETNTRVDRLERLRKADLWCADERHGWSHGLRGRK